MKPSLQKQYTCLDNFLCDGMNGIKQIDEILKKFVDSENAKILQKSLLKIEKYIKTSLSLNCTEKSSCRSHCTSCAISSPTNSKLQNLCPPENHISKCDNCDMIFETLSAIKNEIRLKSNSNDLDENEQIFETSSHNITEWFKHVVRSVHQNLSRVHVFNLLSESNAIWIRDWSQKILKTEYRQAQKNYFGNSGISKHVDVFFWRNQNNQLEKAVYHTVIEQTDQGVLDTLIVADAVLKQMRIDNPTVENLFCRADNAGCYAGNSSFEGLKVICADKGFALQRFDFSEPQDGKDQSDKESAVVNRRLRSYINSGGDVKCAMDIKTGILFHGPPKDTKVAVIKIDSVQSKIENPTNISNILSFHSICFESNNMRGWHYFNVGTGIEIPYSKCKPICIYQVVDPFNSDPMESNCVIPRLSHSSHSNLRFCPDEDCSETFDSDRSFELHLLTGNHTKVVLRSSRDVVLHYYKNRAVSLNDIQRPSTSLRENETNNEVVDESFNPGWALFNRKHGRLNKSTKKFATEIFVEGARTGNKTSAEDCFKLQKVQVTSTGEKQFKAKEWLDITQIKRLFNRYSRLVKTGKIDLNNLLVIEEDNNLKDIVESVSCN